MTLLRLSLAFCVGVLLGCSERSPEPSLAFSVSARTPEGRFGTQCYLSGGDPSRELCEVPFPRLVARSEDYHGRFVLVSGFLVRIFDKPVLFSNELSYLAGVDAEGVEIFDVPELPESILEQMHEGVFPVLVVGTFDAKYVGSSEMRLGAIRNVHHIAHSVRIP